MKNTKAFKIILGIIFLFLFIYNGFIAIDLKYEADGDAWDYIQFGLSIAKTGTYGNLDISRNDILADIKAENVSDKKYISTGPTAFRPPIWSILISGIFLIFGYNLTYLIIFKFLLHLVGILIFYKTLKLLSLREIIIVSGAFLYAVSPAWQLYSRVFLSEPITLFFITLWMYLLIRFIQDKSSWWPQALIAGILVLCHPYYVFLPFSVWLMLFLTRQKSLKLLILSSTLCAAVISVWIVRNFIVLETEEIVLTTSSGAVMAKGWNEKVPEKHTNTKGDLADEELVLQDYLYNENRSYNEVERMQLYKDATLSFVRSNSDLILPIITKKLLSAFNPLPETPRPGILETSRWFFHLLALLALIYIIFFSGNRLIKALAIGLILSTVGITILTYSGFRFRMPQVGLELLLIMVVMEEFWQRNSTKLVN